MVNNEQLILDYPLRNMQLQIISDIHLEFRENRYPFIPRKADNIALLGDIGKPFSNVYNRLIKDLSKRFKRVIIIAGNHEYYSTSRKKMSFWQIREKMVDIADSYDNVYFLENTSMFIDGVRILGATLWTFIPSDMWGTVRKSMNDYKMCFVDTYPENNIGVHLAPEHTVNWHESSVKWLKEELRAPGYQDTPTVILTHHAPYHKGTSNPMYSTNSTQCCYATDLSTMFKSPIITWAYGHTHFPTDITVNDIRLVSNPLGYPDELPGEMGALAHPPIINVSLPKS